MSSVIEILRTKKMLLKTVEIVKVVGPVIFDYDRKHIQFGFEPPTDRVKGMQGMREIHVHTHPEKGNLVIFVDPQSTSERIIKLRNPFRKTPLIHMH